ncbi:MAG: hypothetical protein ACRCVJ_02915 [Clostridium sp.]|uniref:hypothetical protein n=1 Tax=Clostridium sp. TaxID=1506 RepID=UPI003F2FA139
MKENIYESKISIYLDDDSEILHHFYPPDDFNLCEELEEYIIKQVNTRRKRDTVSIKIRLKYEDNIEIFKKALNNTFNKRIISTEEEIRKNKILIIIELIMGCLFGAGVYIFSEINQPLSQLLSIACWVFIWYAVETHFFINRQLRIEKIHYNQIIESNITTK